MSKIFYSWQSDLPNKTNRGLIEKALETAIKALISDDTFELIPAIDRDTAGEAGSPSITETIFRKIDASDIFVADVSLVNFPDAGEPRPKRLTPNPNVLVELGYALSRLGPKRIVMIQNIAFGKLEDLPFDLRFRRALTYTSYPDDQDRASARNPLSAALESALRTIYRGLTSDVEKAPVVDPLEALVGGIKAGQPGQRELARDAMSWLVGRLESVAPSFEKSQERDEELVAALKQAVPEIHKFHLIAVAVADYEAEEVLLPILRGFGAIIDRYSVRESGSYTESDFDFFRFIGYEMMVLLVRPLLNGHRWSLLNKLVTATIPAHNRMNNQNEYRFYDACNTFTLLKTRQARLKTRYITPEGQFLKERHESDIEAQDFPFSTFVDTDIFLFFADLVLFGGRYDTESYHNWWYPITALYLYSGTPQWLREAGGEDVALGLARALRLPDLDNFREHVSRAKTDLSQLYRGSASMSYRPLSKLDPSKLGLG